MSFLDCSDKWIALRVNSSDRASGTSSDFFIYSTAHAFHGTYALQNAILPVTQYNINSGNNVIYFTENATAKSVALPVGYYTSTTLPAAVASAMTTASGGFSTYTSSLNATSQQLTITAGNNFALTFGTNTANSAATALGFAAVDTAAATSQTSNQVVNLLGTLCFNILISDVTGTSSTKGSGASFVVPIDQNSLSVVVYDGKHPLQKVHFESPVKNLRVQLFQDNGQPLSLNACDWQMTLLKLTEYSRN